MHESYQLNEPMNQKTKLRPARRRQADRSSETRAKLFQATVDLLVEKGYAGTSTQEIAKRANVSRGAMLHQFATRADLMTATLGYLYQNEVDDFLAEFDASDQADPVETVWTLYKRPEAKAVFELWLAGRNDKELARVMEPELGRLHEIYSGLWKPVAEAACPSGSDADLQAFKVRFDLVLSAIVGLAMERALLPTAKLFDDEPGILMLLKQTLGLPR